MRLQELMQSRLTSEDVTCRRKPSTWELLTVDPKDSRFFSVCSRPRAMPCRKRRRRKKDRTKPRRPCNCANAFSGRLLASLTSASDWSTSPPPTHECCQGGLSLSSNIFQMFWALVFFFRGLALVLYICIILHPYLWVYLCLALSLDV